MSAARFGRQPPAGSPIRARELRALWREAAPARALAEGLEKRLGRGPVALFASGREALRVGFALLARRSGRSEVLLPAYTCYSVPAAAVAAGLQVRLLDVAPNGELDLDALGSAPLERAAAALVTNLLGVPEPVGELRKRLDAAGVALVDDAAQAFGAASREGPVGARGALGVLSFGRGKPLSGLGGGALVGAEVAAPAPAPPRRGAALARALAYDVARAPAVFRWLGLVPGLHVGETVYDPGFRRGAIDGASLCLAAAALADFDEDTRARVGRARRLAERIAGSSAFRPLLAAAPATAVYPRLGLLAPSREARESALSALRVLGAAALYPRCLADVPALRPHLADAGAEPPGLRGARELAERLLTVPTHAGIRGEREDAVVAALAAAG